MHLLVGFLQVDETQYLLGNTHPPKNCFLCFRTCAVGRSVGTESVNTALSCWPPGYFELTVQERRLPIS